MTNIVTRFAPSPTGFMHIGGARTALYAYFWARKHEGTFILRIEDTDLERKVEGSIEHIIESLTWLGLDWDYGPQKPGPFGSCIQSERLDLYRAYAQKLIDKGYAYPDPYSAEEVDALRKRAQAEKRPFLFREHRPQEMGMWDGKRPLRFRIPEIKRMHWTDAVRGELEAGEEALDDFILIKSDGYPTYNFAHIVDDTEMGVTHVFRADEFISSTPRFLSLYEALEVPKPVFVTLPPILRPDRMKKLGKRDGAKDILEYRAEGILSDAMVNCLAFVGWNPGTDQEIFSPKELISSFDISHVQAGGAVFNEEKLLWYNKQWLERLSADDFAEYVRAPFEEGLASRNIAPEPDRIRAIAPILKNAISNLRELKDLIAAGEYDFFFVEPQLNVAEIPEKKSNPTDAQRHLEYARGILAQLATYDYDSVKGSLWDYATEQGRGAVLWPLRYSLSGRSKSPDPFVIASIIGKEATLRRVDAALALLAV